MSSTDRVFEMLERLRAMRRFAPDTVAAVLGIEMFPVESPYGPSVEGALAGTFARVRMSDLSMNIASEQSGVEVHIIDGIDISESTFVERWGRPIQQGVNPTTATEMFVDSWGTPLRVVSVEFRRAPHRAISVRFAYAR